MKLEEMTWLEVQQYLETGSGILLPTGSIEQHGPIGLIGTDAICAREIASRVADKCNAIVAPELAYAPANFNMGFPGTVSVTPDLFAQLAGQVVDSLTHHGFDRIYILNGHGANLAPLAEMSRQRRTPIRIRSWWDFDAVNALRSAFFDDWEGMHATPSEISITQHTHRVIPTDGLPPPRKLSSAYIREHGGDKHAGPRQHRKDFPDGRVGSHSGLAKPEYGKQLIDAATEGIAADFRSFVG